MLVTLAGLLALWPVVQHAAASALSAVTVADRCDGDHTGSTSGEAFTEPVTASRDAVGPSLVERVEGYAALAAAVPLGVFRGTGC